LIAMERLYQVYFNRVYNPTYDWTVGRFTAYHRLQRRCVADLDLRDGDRVLCVGIGTGNEIGHLFETGRQVQITAIDTSERALRLAADKADELGHDVRALQMDARRLAFPSETFDKAVCIHVMDFVGDTEVATREVMRVLKPGGRFVITYPYEKEGSNLGANIVRDGLLQDLKERRLRDALRQLAALVAVSAVYAPFVFRPRQRVYNPAEIEGILQESGAASCLIGRDGVYVDLVVTGVKDRRNDIAKEGASGGLVLLQPERGGALA
jgi:ubiquinone/menaquinone biosynthesis C-methylase UbiE